MRIVMVVPGGVDRSGRERVVPALLWLIERLARRHDLLVVALNQERAYSEYDLLGARVACLGRASGPIRELNLFNRLIQFRKALRAYGGRPDIFHAISAGEVGVLAGIAGRLHKKPVVTSIFNGELTWLPEIGYGWQGSWRGRLAVSQSVRLARALTVGSQFAGRDLGRRPWHWVPLGVDERLFTDVPSAPQGPPWRLLHIAHINPVKDQGTLLRAVRMVADKRPVRLDWFGQDTLDGRLQELTKALDLDALVRFHGFRPLDELIPYYRQAHLLLQSSRYESQGVAVCEAAALGVPTVGTAVGLVAELAPQAAMAVAVGDASGLAEAVLGLLADRSEREMLGAAARRWAWHHHAGWTADQFEKIYDDCLRNG